MKVRLNGHISESDTKRVYVLSPNEPDGLVSIYIWDNNSELRWNSSVGEQYDTYVQINDNETVKIEENYDADTGDNTAYEVIGLVCDIK